MNRITSEQVEKARQVDLLTFFQKYYPDALVKVAPGTWSTVEHDSLKMSNGMWMWWSRRIGGRSALDYLIKVEGYQFADAVIKILDGFDREGYVRPEPVSFGSEKEIRLPEKNDNNDRVIAYLTGRGIDREIIDYCIKKKILYESLPYHNAVFLGHDQNGQVRYGCYRATNPRRIMGDVSGSDKAYSFRIARANSSTVHLFESAIDLLSYATIVKINGDDWKNNNMLSLAGVYLPGSNKRDGGMPKAFKNYIQNSLPVKEVVVHFDNDETGRQATKGFTEAFESMFVIKDEPAECGKDFNDMLVMKYRNSRNREEESCER